MKNLKLERLKLLAEKNPDNPKFLEDYVAALYQEGMLIHARKLMQKLYTRLTIKGRLEEAEMLKLTHGDWVAGEEEGVRRSWGGPFLPLEKEVKKSFFSRKRKKSLREGEALFRTGDPADKIYLVIEGELAVSVNSPTAGHILISMVFPGDLIGEGALRPDALRSADVFANKDSKLIEFDRYELTETLASQPYLKETFDEEASLRRKVTALSKSRPFSFLTLAERVIVAEQSSEMSIEAGTMIKREDEQLPYVALIVSGEVETHFTEYRQRHYAGSLYQNTLFGLSKLYLPEDIPYELTAKNDVDLLIIPSNVIHDAALTYQRFDSGMYDIARSAYSRTMETIRILSSSPDSSFSAGYA